MTSCFVKFESQHAAQKATPAQFTVLLPPSTCPQSTGRGYAFQVLNMEAVGLRNMADEFIKISIRETEMLREETIKIPSGQYDAYNFQYEINELCAGNLKLEGAHGSNFILSNLHGHPIEVEMSARLAVCMGFMAVASSATERFVLQLEATGNFAESAKRAPYTYDLDRFRRQGALLVDGATVEPPTWIKTGEAFSSPRQVAAFFEVSNGEDKDRRNKMKLVKSGFDELVLHPPISCGEVSFRLVDELMGTLPMDPGGNVAILLRLTPL